MRVINNKVYILRGETPTYTLNLKDRDTGLTWVMPRIDNPYLEFIIRPSIYSDDSDSVYTAFVSLSDMPKGGITPLSVANWSDVVAGMTTFTVGKAYSVQNSPIVKVCTQASASTVSFEEYEFKVDFVLPYDTTKGLENKTYKYEITLLGGTVTGDSTLNTNDNPYAEITYKKVILAPTDFVVGGSISE